MNRTLGLIKIEANVLLVISFFLLIPLGLAILYEECAAAKAFIIVASICALTFILVKLTLKKEKFKLEYRDGFLVATVTWVLIGLVGSLPYLISGAIPSIVDAIFESVSGYSTTGATILSDVESLPKSLQFYRSLTHFLGGMGILVLLSAILPSWGVNGQTIANSESTGPVKGKITTKFSDSTKALYTFYIIMTLLDALLLKLAGMRWLDSFIHAMGTMGTGGFSNYNDGLVHFSSPLIYIITIVFMLIAGTNFNLLIFGGKHRLRNLVKDEEFRFYIGVIAITTILISVSIIGTNIAAHKYEFNDGSLLDSIFQVVSIMTTTGFASSDYLMWPTFAQALIFMLFFIGGCACSTSGGIKSIRILTAIKLLKRSFSMKLHPNRIVEIKQNDKDMSTDTVIRVVTFLMTYILILITGTMLISTSGVNLMTSLSVSASSIGNIGPAFGLCGPMSNYSILSPFAKLVSSSLMLIGRLEILTVFVLFSKYYRNPNRTH